MKHVFKVLLHLLTLTIAVFMPVAVTTYEEPSPVYLGVTFCGDTVNEAKLLIDKVKDYTNLLVLQSGSIMENQSAINEICDYATGAGLNIIVYFGWFDPDSQWQLSWLDYAHERWADKFLGIYYSDEPAGRYLDYDWSDLFSEMKEKHSAHYQIIALAIDGYLNGTLPRDYKEAASRFVDLLQDNPCLKELHKRSITAFTSDYALYWFDYLGGYDVVFAEFGWNNSVAQEISLVRGAAKIQDKDWGAIITWKYETPPYLDTGEEIFTQMQTALESGAKYIVLFNYPILEDNPYGTLLDSHFKALEKTWDLIESTPRTSHNSPETESVLVLPENYGYGMRSDQDKIWFWEPDENCLEIWQLARFMLNQEGLNLDIVYAHQDYPHVNIYSTCLVA